MIGPDDAVCGPSVAADDAMAQGGLKEAGEKGEGGDKHQRGGVQCRGQDGEGKVS